MPVLPDLGQCPHSPPTVQDKRLVPPWTPVLSHPGPSPRQTGLQVRRGGWPLVTAPARSPSALLDRSRGFLTGVPAFRLSCPSLYLTQPPTGFCANVTLRLLGSKLSRTPPTSLGAIPPIHPVPSTGPGTTMLFSADACTPTPTQPNCSTHVSETFPGDNIKCHEPPPPTPPWPRLCFRS